MRYVICALLVILACDMAARRSAVRTLPPTTSNAALTPTSTGQAAIADKSIAGFAPMSSFGFLRGDDLRVLWPSGVQLTDVEKSHHQVWMPTGSNMTSTNNVCRARESVIRATSSR